MNYKKISLLMLTIFLVFPINNVLAFTHVDKITVSTSVFFLVNLNAGDRIDVSITHEDDGNFYLFLFDERPEETKINLDGKINQEIFRNALAYSLGDQPSINYVAREKKIYYIQVILYENGPDIYTLTCNKELTRYYLPIIPGYPVELVSISLVFSIGLIIALQVRRRIKIKNNI